LGNLF